MTSQKILGKAQIKKVWAIKCYLGDILNISWWHVTIAIILCTYLSRRFVVTITYNYLDTIQEKQLQNFSWWQNKEFPLNSDIDISIDLHWYATQ